MSGTGSGFFGLRVEFCRVLGLGLRVDGWTIGILGGCRRTGFRYRGRSLKACEDLDFGCFSIGHCRL